MEPQGRGLGLPITAVDEDKNCLGMLGGQMMRLIGK